jgi:hypothetical protein
MDLFNLIFNKYSRLRQKSLQSGQGMLWTFLVALQSRTHILLLPLLTLFGGPKFDHYGWKNMKVAGTSSALEIIEVDTFRKIVNNMEKQNSGERAGGGGE